MEQHSDQDSESAAMIAEVAKDIRAMTSSVKSDETLSALYAYIADKHGMTVDQVERLARNLKTEEKR